MNQQLKMLTIQIWLIGLCTVIGHAQQNIDTVYRFHIEQTAYPFQKGPLILIDEAHNNLHQSDSGFAPLKILLEQDGYRVKGLTDNFEALGALDNANILVIANALHPNNLGNWVLPTPSAFTSREISKLKSWVEDGGNILLIADHMPFAGAADDLAHEFGFDFLNGFAITDNNAWPPSVFKTNNQGLEDSKIIDGIKDYESIDSVATFTGSAFKIPHNAIPVLKFSDVHHSLQPDTAWVFNSETPVVNLDNYYQGALLKYGKGRIAVFGEAAMFTAQIANRNLKAGFNSELAPQNAQFVLNLIHWLDNIDKYETINENVSVNSSEEMAILKALQGMEEAFLANKFLKVAEFYADDAVLIGNKQLVSGRNEVDQYWLGLQDRGVSWSLENTHLEIYKEVAIQRGVSRMKFDYQGQEHLSEVRFTLVWKKIDGKWKISIDHYSLM